MASNQFTNELEEIFNNQTQKNKLASSKNAPKLFAKQLQQFIKNNLKNNEDLEEQLNNDPEIRDFLHLDSKQLASFGKQKLIGLFSNSIINQFANHFLGNMVWIRGVLKNNKKGDIDSLFKLNQELLEEVIQKRRNLN